MDIVRFKGGLGNQMFQYAFIEALKSRGREVKGSIGGYLKNPNTRSYFLTKVFPEIDLDYVTDCEFDIIDNEWRKIKQNEERRKEFCNDYVNRFFWVEDIKNEPCTYHPEVFLTRECTFVGHWQSEKYFKNIRNILVSKFFFTKLIPKLREFGEMLTESNYTSVHVRRGDYLLYPDVYMVCTIDYYLKAINYIKQKESYTKFIFFSDDIGWVKEHIKISDALYFNNNMFESYEDWYDMYLISKCKHNIIANSTFSWWGAWLNQNINKIVIAPRRWHNNNSTPDIWCDEWIKL